MTARADIPSVADRARTFAASGTLTNVHFLGSTAVFVLGEEAPAWLAGRRGRTGLIVFADGRTELVGAAEDVC